uniref:Reverse transcriptase/retrotransposon-derived protein RNase H-like domain-containing protein n=1 Tax=Aegilops tauschii subsp. strangulata TaxID=200361 RepID=A0A452Z4F3_AEGTS
MFGVPSGKRLGFLVSYRGIKASPEKVKAIEDMSPPQTLKDMQKLAGCVTSLGRFISKLGERALPFFKLMKKKGQFEWTPKADQPFQDVKRYLTSPPVMVAPRPLEPLVLYLAATPYSASAALLAVREERQAKVCRAVQHPQPGRYGTHRAPRRLQRRQRVTKPTKAAFAGLQRPQWAIKLSGSRHLRRRPNLRQAQAPSTLLPSSSTQCTSSARYCRMQGHGTPCLKSSCSRSWWPRVNCGTTSKVTQSRSSRPTRWRGCSGAPTLLEESPNGTSSYKRSSWSSAQPGSSREPRSPTSWRNGLMPRGLKQTRTDPSRQEVKHQIAGSCISISRSHARARRLEQCSSRPPRTSSTMPC